jgi:hypothetical protein
MDGFGLCGTGRAVVDEAADEPERGRAVDLDVWEEKGDVAIF